MADDTGHDTGPIQVVPDTGTPRWSGNALRWSAARAARETGAARSTILAALQSGRLEGTKDADGHWQITPEALGAAGFHPGRPAPPEDAQPLEVDRDDDTTRLRLELVEARADARVLTVERDAERRLREAAERERDVYRRMIEQSPQARLDAPQTAATPERDQTPTPDPVRPSTGNVGRLRRAWNIARYG